MKVKTNREVKIPQQKYFQREHFSIDEKFDILKKSGGKCCHCGKDIYAGYTMTVDHFIPLFKGGSNQGINLIPLCEDCNKNKDDKLYSMDYIKFLKPKHKKELGDYLNSYVNITDYVQRHRLLAYDQYDSELVTSLNGIFSRHGKDRDKKLGVRSKYCIKLATWDDLDKLHNYLVKYLKKIDSLDNIESARQNIIFWLQFGCIYYVERDNDIKIMVATTIKHLSSFEDFRGINNQPYMYVFPYYNTEISISMMTNIVYDIPDFIRRENNLDFIPINVLFLKKEKMKDIMSAVMGASLTQDSVPSFNCMHAIIGKVENNENAVVDYEDMTDEERKVADFFRKFDDVTDQVVSYIAKYSDSKNIAWMLSSIISTSLIKQHKGAFELISAEGITIENDDDEDEE